MYPFLVLVCNNLVCIFEIYIYIYIYIHFFAYILQGSRPKLSHYHSAVEKAPVEPSKLWDWEIDR
ncbi:MAG: hypothetical protein MCS20_01195, partial [Candidatus Phytoplasma mali]|nr:hypothetical protein [Candidatus Phytoplasma australiense]MCG7202015.1 hypothetical protein [Candidatus Phytoplasma mali]